MPPDHQQRIRAAADEFLRRRRSGEEGGLLDYLEQQPAELREELGRACLSLDLFADQTGPGTSLQSGMRVGEFVLRERLGAGGMGVVHRAQDCELGREVALKFLHPFLAQDAEGLERFQREVATLAALRHPTLVPVYRVGMHQGAPFFAMEYVRGRSLRDLARDGRDVARAVDLVATIARGLHHAHELGIVHRDVKPENVIVEEDGRPRLLDFGIAKSLGPGARSLTGSLVGTPEYMSPEQIAGRPEAIDRRTDVYALGAVLYELLAGRRPFQGTHSQVMTQVATRDPAPLRRVDPRLPRDLETICARALERDSNDRYPTAAALADDLERFARYEPILAVPPGPWERACKLARREPARAALWLVLFVGMPVALGAGIWGRSELARREAARRQLVSEDLDRAWDALALAEMFHPQGRHNRSLDGSALGFPGLMAASERSFEQALAQAEPSYGVDVEAACGLALVRRRLGREGALPQRLPGGRRELTTVFERICDLGADPPATSPAEQAFLLLLEGLTIQPEGPPEDLQRRLERMQSAVWLLPAPRSFFHYQLGRALAAVGDHAGAARVARAIERLWPESAEAHFQAAMLLDGYDATAAEAAYLRAVELDPALAFIGHHQLAYRALERGDVKAHAAHLERAVALGEDDPWLTGHLYDLGFTLAPTDPAGAERRYRECLALAPNSYRAAHNLAALIVGQGRHEQALALLEQAAEHAPEGPQRAVVLTELGAQQLARGDGEAALASLSRATSMSPANGLAWLALARARIAAGDRVGAEQALERAARSGTEEARLAEVRAIVADPR